MVKSGTLPGSSALRSKVGDLTNADTLIRSNDTEVSLDRVNCWSLPLSGAEKPAVGSVGLSFPPPPSNRQKGTTQQHSWSSARR